LFRLSTQTKSASTTVTKVSFEDISADGQNKENDQPVAMDDTAEEMIDDNKHVAPQLQQVCNNMKDADSDEGEAKIIPWRAKLRKTNSTLNLLE